MRAGPGSGGFSNATTQTGVSAPTIPTVASAAFTTMRCMPSLCSRLRVSIERGRSTVSVPSLIGATATSTALAMSPRSFDAFATPKLAALGLGAVLLVALGGILRRPSRPSLPWMASGVILLVIAAQSPEQLAGVPNYRHGIVTLIFLAVVAFAASRVSSGGHPLRQIMDPVALAAIAIVSYSWAQQAGVDPIAWSIQEPFGTIGNPNSLACFLLTVAATYMFSPLIVRPRPALVAVLSAACFSVVPLTTSRVGLVTAVALLGCYAIRPGRSVALVLGAAAALLFGSVATNGTTGQRVLETRAPIEQELDHSDEVRWEIWRVSAGLLGTSVFFGRGPVGFEKQFESRLDPRYPALWELADFGKAPVEVDSPHSIVLEFGLFFGVIPATVMAILLAVSVARRPGPAFRPDRVWLLWPLGPVVVFGLLNPLGLAELTLAAVLTGLLLSDLPVATPRSPAVLAGV
jgi:O-Antigen ligase